MIKVSLEVIADMETRYPGITEQIYRWDNMVLPPCPSCGSKDTADVQIGVIGRTMHIDISTSKFKLTHRPQLGNTYCNSCKKYFFRRRQID